MRQHVRDRDILGTLFHAGTALDALGGISRLAVHQFAAHPEGVAEFCFFDRAEQVHLVVFLETEGDHDIGGTGHAVAATGAADFHEFPIGAGGACHAGQFFGGEAVGVSRARDGPVFRDVRLVIQAGENDRDLGPVPDPAQGPFRRGTAYRGLVPDRRYGRRRGGEAQVAAAQGFHHDHAQAF